MKSFKTYLREQQESEDRRSNPWLEPPELQRWRRGDGPQAWPPLTSAERENKASVARERDRVNDLLMGGFTGALSLSGHSLRTDTAPTPLELMNQFYSDPTSSDTSNLGYVQQIVRTRRANPNHARAWPQNFQDYRLDQPFALPVEADDKEPRTLTARPPGMEFELDNDPDSMEPLQGMDTGVLLKEPGGRDYTLGSIQAERLGLAQAAENISGRSTEIDPRILTAITNQILSQPRRVPSEGPYISSQNKDNIVDIPAQGADYAVTTRMIGYTGDNRMYRMGSSNYPWNQDFSIAYDRTSEDGLKAKYPADIPGVSISQGSESELARLATQQISQLKRQYKQGGGPTIRPDSPESDVNRFVDFVIPNLGSSEELSRYLEFLVPRQTPEERKDKAYREALKNAAKVIAKGTSSQLLDPNTRMA